MRIPLLILLAAGPVGALDVLYFHIWKFSLYSRPQSSGEQLVHLIRAVVAPLLFAILLAGRPEGAWYWLVAVLFAMDTINSAVDVVLEPASRAPIGVPRAELALHFIGTMAMGAAWGTFMVAGWDTRNGAAALRAHTDLPPAIALLAWSSLAIAAAVFLFETLLVFRARAGGQAPSPVPAGAD